MSWRMCYRCDCDSMVLLEFPRGWSKTTFGLSVAQTVWWNLPDHKLQGVLGTAASPKATPKETKTLHFILKERPAVCSALFQRQQLFWKHWSTAKVWVLFRGSKQRGNLTGHLKDSVACVFFATPTMGLAKFFPGDNPQQCLCAQIYGERTYKDLGYLEEVEYTCTEQKAALRKRTEVMKDHIVFPHLPGEGC